MVVFDCEIGPILVDAPVGEELNRAVRITELDVCGWRSVVLDDDDRMVAGDGVGEGEINEG